ncbi:hypothetical protein MARGE09_P3963 [Marinagarivorans cellulosilyticus]|uniref:SnoaL-like domain-containing protein n=2 Tax=Marinagarivorans cellulosilyticus TaxID=2721545 RepID=A0AAN1WLE8_9GAMM|nr:hypothetical protein MARGE09_P3963 [Marinagarivorans cellulosilyticus]
MYQLHNHTKVVVSMFFRVTLSALILFFLAGCQEDKNTIKKSTVLKLFSEIKELYLTGNVDAMMDHYTDDIIVVANMTRETSIKGVKTNISLKFSKEKYKALIESVAAKASGHTYTISNLTITTEKGLNRAFASYDASENMSLDDEIIETKSFVEISLIKAKSGKLLISGMTVTEV